MSIPVRPRAVVTGAGSGLGRAFCLELARRGGRVLASDVDLASAEATVAMMPAGSGRAVQCDVARAEEVHRLAEEAEGWMGGVDLVVNNAGVGAGGKVGEVSLEDWKWLMGVNLWGVVHGCHEFVPRLVRQGSGHVLNVASAAGLLCTPQMAPYNVSKAGVIALSETLHGELAGTGVGVTVLCPTFFRTNILNTMRGAADPTMNKLAETLMERSKLTADDVARIALDGAAQNELYVLPHADGRWAWRLKRALPESFYRLTPKLMGLGARRQRTSA